MTCRISHRTCYTKLNFDFPYVRFLSLRRDTFVVFVMVDSLLHWYIQLELLEYIKCTYE